MSDDRKDLPPANSANFLEKVREALSVYLGNRGDKLDRGVTLRDLTEAGLVSLRPGFLTGKGSKNPITGPGTAVEDAYEVDLTPPPTPTGFAVSAAISNVFIEHDAASYTSGNGHAKTVVYGATYTSGALPVFADAVVITEFSGTVFAHATNPATTWHLWIKWVSRDGVESTIAAGGTNGLVATTGQDVSTLLTVLEGELTESQLSSALSTRVDLIDGPSGTLGTVNFRVAAEAAARAAAIATEVTDRNAAILVETNNRTSQLAAETAARINGDTVESIARTAQVQEVAYAALEATLAANDINAAVRGDVALARSELTTDLQAGLSAEAALRTILAAKLDTDIGTTLAVISDEATARATGDAAEATQREILSTQLLGADGTGLTSGLIFSDRVARSTEDLALAQQITLLSAGAGEQFDWQTIWYFDTGIESWSGNGTPTASAGWLRPANQASGAYVESPSGFAAEAAKYGQVRLRARKTGSPTWAGYLYWQATTDSTWDNARRIALDEPTWDVNGIGLITVSPAWSATINKIRVDASSAQGVSDYYEWDWVAIGRPSPGASSAQLLVEQTARVDADGVLTTNLASLSAQVNNATTGLPATRADLITEQTTRANADTAEAAARTTLAARVTTAEGSIVTNASAISSEATTRATADTTNANAIAALSSTVTDPSTGLAKTRADLITTQDTLATATEANAREFKSLTSASRAIDEATLRNVLTGNATRDEFTGTLASATQELRADIVAGISAEASARLALAAVVDANTASLVSEQTTRANADTAEANARLALAAVVDSNTAAITSEATTRATADTAEANARIALAATVSANTAAIVSEQIVRANADSAEAAAREELTAVVDANTAAIVSEQTARATADSAQVTSIDSLTAQVNHPTTGLPAAHAAVVSEANARASADSAIASDVTTLEASVTSINSTLATKATISYVDTAKADAISAGAASVATVQAQLNTGGATANAIAAAQSTANTAVTTSSANASAISTVQGRLDSGDYAAVKVESAASASSVTGLLAQYTVKLDVNGKVSGFGLASTGPTGTGSEFQIRADKFSIAAPTGAAAGYAPFTVLATDQVIGGVTFPAGVYAQRAFIQDAQITTAKIDDLAVDNAKIANLNVSKLEAGTIDTGDIRSSFETLGVPSWSINGSTGAATFNSAVVRGTVYASAGQIGGNTIDATGIESPGYTAGDTGWRLDTSGLVRAFASGGARVLDLAATGTDSVLKVGSVFNITGDGNASFSGDITGATGEFGGTLRAGVIDLSTAVGTSVEFSTPGTYSVTVPSGYARPRLRYRLVGGGGGGGGAGVSQWYLCGGGGGGGEVITATTDLGVITAGSTLTVVVGAAGAAGSMGTYSGYPGGDGGNTYVTGVSSVADGGKGGGGSIAPSTYGAGGLAGGVGGSNGAAGGSGGGKGGNSFGAGGIGGAYPSQAPVQGVLGGGGGGGFGSYGPAYPSTAGASGGAGYALIEIFDDNAVVLQNSYNILLAALQRQGIDTE